MQITESWSLPNSTYQAEAVIHNLHQKYLDFASHLSLHLAMV